MKIHPFLRVCNGWESRNQSRAYERLDCEASTAFGTTCVNYSTAAFGLHAHQKAMRTSAANFRRLIGTFHRKPLSNSLKPKRA